MKKMLFRLWMLGLVILLSACSSQAIVSGEQIAESDVQATAGAEATANPDAGAVTAAEAMSANGDTHEDETDYTWDESEVISLTFDGDSAAVDGEGVALDGGIATIQAAGTYRLSGRLDDGQILVDTLDKGIVRLILDGVELHSSTSAPIYVRDAQEVQLVLAAGSENQVSDASGYVFEDAAEEGPNAAIYSKADMTITGSGSLTVNGNAYDGITSTDGLIITGGTIAVSAVDDGIRGKDYLVVEDGSLAIQAQGDGLKSDNEDDTTLGYISIESGTFEITAGGDAMTAQTDVVIAAGEFNLSSGGGSGSKVDETTSAKGIKALVNLVIEDGGFMIDSADDGLHSNGSIVVNDGTFTITSGDDGMHADSTLEVNGGTIEIADSYEGMESAVITLNAGEISIVSSDDGLNVAAGVDGSGMMAGPGFGGDAALPGQPGEDMPRELPGDVPGQAPQRRPGGGMSPGQDSFAESGDNYLYIHGGTILIHAGGDGIDANGFIEVTGGLVLVNGPTENMNGALDSMGSFTISGGTLVASGSAGMAQGPGSTSSQPSVLIYFDTLQPAGTLVHIQDSEGKAVLTFEPEKEFQSLVFSSPELVSGTEYEVYTGGSMSGAASAGLYSDGSYSAGTLQSSFSLSDVLTQVGQGGGRFR